MDGPRGYYAKWIKSEKDKYNIISLIVESKEQKRTNKTNSDTENKPMLAKWKGGWGAGWKGEGIKQHRLAVTQ